MVNKIIAENATIQCLSAYLPHDCHQVSVDQRECAFTLSDVDAQLPFR